MYCLTEDQIAFIQRDIQSRGVEMESLQQDLLDHVCCLIEQDLEPGGDFEAFYATVIRTFYRKELKEIEEETIFLLTYKNYYAMKKIMLTSGAFSASVLSAGILFKFMHWPGAGVLLVTGIVLFSLVFLPLMFTLKVREKSLGQNVFMIGTGTLSAICISLSILFKLMHWPGGNVLGVSAIGIILLLFLPVYFFTGIRNAETKMNSIVTSILIVAGSGLLMSLVRTPGGSTAVNRLNTVYFLRNEQILQHEQKQVDALLKTSAVPSSLSAQSRKINQLCQELKAGILEHETGYKILGDDFEAKNALISDGWVRSYIQDNPAVDQKIQLLRQEIKTYNQTNAQISNPDFHAIPVQATVLDMSEERVNGALNSFTQIQMLVLQNQRELLAGR